MHEAELLERLAAEEAEAAEKAPEDEVSAVFGRAAALRLVGLRCRKALSQHGDDGEQKHESERHAASREGVGADRLHADRLGDEGAAPDEGCDKKQPRLAEFEEKVGIRHRAGD